MITTDTNLHPLPINGKKYKKKPVEIEAIQYTGENGSTVAQWAMGKRNDDTKCRIHLTSYCILIDTLEGVMRASAGDYIIKGVNGEFYPCKPDIFKKTYEEVK